MKGTFSFPTGGLGKNVITFGADMSFLYILITKKNVFIPGEYPTQGLYNTTMFAEKIHS